MVKSGYSISSAIIEHYYLLRNLLSVIKDFKPRVEKLHGYIGDLVNISLRSTSGVQIFPKLKGIIEIDQSITLL